MNTHYLSKVNCNTEHSTLNSIIVSEIWQKRVINPLSLGFYNVLMRITVSHSDFTVVKEACESQTEILAQIFYQKLQQ